MAINPSSQYPGRITAPDANYTYGSSKNETSPGAGDGTPYEIARANDVFGMQQALLNLASIVPSGSAETQLISQYVRSIVELASGRAVTCDDSGVADAYVLTEQTNQQAPQSLYDGLICEFIPTANNTGVTTVNPYGLGVTNVFFQGAACIGGEILTTRKAVIKYDLVNTRFNLILNNEQAIETILGELKIASQALVDAGVNDTDAVTSLKLHTKPGQVVQTVSVTDGAVATGSTIIPLDDTIPQNTEGDEFMTLSVTPDNASNLLKIETVCCISSSSIGNFAAALFQDVVANSLAVISANVNVSFGMVNLSFTHWMTAGTTSPTIFKIRAGNDNAGTWTFNGTNSVRRYGGALVSSITITEYRV